MLHICYSRHYSDKQCLALFILFLLHMCRLLNESHIHALCQSVIHRCRELLLLFQNNPHKLTLVMTPEEDYDKNCRDAELRKLVDKVSVLSADEKENVYKTGKSLLF